MLALILDEWNNVEVISKVTVESLVNQCVDGVGRPLVNLHTLFVLRVFLSATLVQLEGLWGRRVPIGMVGRSTGGSLGIGN